MVDCERGALEATGEESNAAIPDYGELIIEMVHKINNTEILEYLYTFVRLFLKRWG